MNQEGTGLIPEDYMMYNLQLEWGLTSKEFNEEPIEKILKILQYKQAEALGQSRKQ